MWSVRTIPPNNLVPTQLKVAAYCRVSTNSLEQQTSLSSQEQYYEEWIIIAYTYDCEAVKATAMKNNWFEDDEIRLLE